MKYKLGIDIGGTNVAFGLVDETGKVQRKESVNTNSFDAPEDLFEEIKHQLSEELSSISGVGIGAPNGNSKTGKIEFAPNLKWTGIVDVIQLAENVFGLPAKLVNDANAAALGEKHYGVAKDWSDFVCITLGTGLGSGVIVNNELVIGSNGLAGEFGHIVVIPKGRQCGCGRQGCLETYVSSKGVKKTLEIGLESWPSKFVGVNAEDSVKDIFDKAEKGHYGAMEIVDYTADILGQALANFAAFSNPQGYVLFGGLAQSGAFFKDKVESAMNKSILSIYNKTQIRISSLSAGDAAILGAAAII